MDGERRGWRDGWTDEGWMDQQVGGHGHDKN